MVMAGVLGILGSVGKGGFPLNGFERDLCGTEMFLLFLFFLVEFVF